MPQVKWLNHKSVWSDSSALSLSFQELILANDLFQFVNEPTRKGKEQASVLDRLFASRQSLIRDVNRIPGISDHDCVRGYLSPLNCKVVHSNPRKVFFYIKGDYAALSNKLQSFLPKFIEMSQSHDCNTLWDALKNKFNWNM